MTNLFFSVIIPTWNRAQLVKRTVESFLKQSYPHFELIVVDDGGTDDTAAILAALNDRRISYHHKQNGERGAARKFGAALAKGDYINYFDSDDTAYPDHLEKALQAITRHRYPMVVHLGYEMKDEEGKLLFRRKSFQGTGNKKLLRLNYINPNPLFVHRDTLQAVTYHPDRNLAAVEDWLYHLQLAARYEFLSCNEHITSCMIEHQGRSMSNYSGDAVLNRTALLVRLLKEDEVFMKNYGHSLKLVEGEMTGLAALHYVLEKKKTKALQYLLKSFRLSPSLIFKRRTLAIGKYLILR